jgi:hypothetical protein
MPNSRILKSQEDIFEGYVLIFSEMDCVVDLNRVLLTKDVMVSPNLVAERAHGVLSTIFYIKPDKERKHVKLGAAN